MKALRLLLCIPLYLAVLLAAAVLIAAGAMGEFIWGDE